MCPGSYIVFMLIARMGVGIGEAGAIPPAHSLIADYFPPDARAFALFTTASAVGSLVALAGGSQVAANYGWRAAFLFMAALSAPIAMLAGVALVEPRAPRPRLIVSEAPRHGITSNIAAPLTKPSYPNLLILIAVIFFALPPLYPAIQYVRQEAPCAGRYADCRRPKYDRDDTWATIDRLGKRPVCVDLWCPEPAHFHDRDDSYIDAGGMVSV